MDRWVTPPKRVTSLTWGPPPPCKQVLTKHENCDLHNYCKHKFACGCKFSTFPVLCFKREKRDCRV